MTVIVTGKAYSQQTGDWTEEVRYEARDRMEAVRWMRFNQDWMKDLKIVDDAAPGMIRRPLGFYIA